MAETDQAAVERCILAIADGDTGALSELYALSSAAVFGYTLSVLRVREDAEKVVGDMDFSGASLEITVNALIGAMYRHGYLGELANSVLVTVNEAGVYRLFRLGFLLSVCL